MDGVVAEVRRRIEEKRVELAPGDYHRTPRGDGGRRDPLTSGEHARRAAVVFGLELALGVVDEVVRERGAGSGH